MLFRSLAPLCEAARRESKIARGVNRALEALARHDLVALAIAHELPMTFDYDGTLLTDGSLETALVNALTYQPKEPPVLSDVGPTEFDAPWTVQDVLAALSAAGSVDDLLTWIITTCQAAQPERAIRLLHAVLLENPGQVHCDGARRIFVFGELVVQTAVWKWSQTHEPASR